MSHDATGNRNDLIKIQTWYAEQFKYLLDALKGHEEEGGSILDSSVVLWVNELSDGDVHNRRDLGWIIAGLVIVAFGFVSYIFEKDKQ